MYLCIISSHKIRLVKAGIIKPKTKDEKGFKMNYGAGKNKDDNSDGDGEDY